MKKVANKIALIIVVLLVVSLAVFSTVSYTNTKGNIYDLAKESKTSASKVLQFYMNAFFEDKLAAVQNFASYIEAHPQILDDKEALEKFENLIFSGIVLNSDKIPGTFDGVESLASLVQALKGDKS